LKTATLHYPYYSVFKALQFILLKKGFTVELLDMDKGLMRASKTNLGFDRGIYDIKIVKLNDQETGLEVALNANQSSYQKARTIDEHSEERLIDAISKFF